MILAAKTERQFMYKEKAEAAARCEQLGNYQQAYNLWCEAMKLATTEKQKQWCSTRANYCHTWQGKRERVR
ncbi:ANR family transcriptional regulator [Actinobacillus capsulatus]|uniref:ANR family transcriptional regulator n=1 Tax=Actinobacillus capsulatus TaxID=717 RepID=UPI00037D10A3|nr:ANR family transcriptional regulator [Actinobacillus capsulatus]